MDKLETRMQLVSVCASQIKILDVGCGVGACTLRLAQLYPKATVIGVDLEERHLKQARAALEALPKAVQKRVTFKTADAYKLSDFKDGEFDLVVCRSMLYAVKQPELVVDQLVRVAKKQAPSAGSARGGGRKARNEHPGGVVHLLAEDFMQARNSACPSLFLICARWIADCASPCKEGVGRMVAQRTD